ncbi:MAG: hypothetical protein KC503_34130 [Myxococcales bacterium]|nr:hypothetical protein [Myxococcales bacterium]
MLAWLLVAWVGCDSRSVGSDGALDSGREATAPDATYDCACADLAPQDSAPLDVAGADLAPGDGAGGDQNTSFPAVFEGLWLVGWSGGLNHFSWVRFAPLGSAMKAKAYINRGANIIGNAPLLDCDGETTWWIGAAFYTTYLDLPSSSCNGDTTAAWVFSNFGPTDALAPAALLRADVKEQATSNPLYAYKFPDNWCDATLTTCKKPF